jgi:hypothetical protein
MTLLIAICALSAVIFAWLWQIERGHRLTAEVEADLIHSDYLALQAAHDAALDDLDDMVDAITANARLKHPTGRLSLIRGEGA